MFPNIKIAIGVLGRSTNCDAKIKRFDKNLATSSVKKVLFNQLMVEKIVWKWGVGSRKSRQKPFQLRG